jgi:hypothetical protein
VFGAALRHAACVTGQTDCRKCPLWRRCAYPALFETPPQETQFRQQFSAVPNPYVIEPPALGMTRVPIGEDLVFQMVLFGEDTLRQLPLVVMAWQRALRQGLGPTRVVGELRSVELVAPDGAVMTVFDPATGRVLPHAAQWHVHESGVPDPSGDKQVIDLHFGTPLRLQSQGRPLDVNELSPRTLVSQMLRRINLVLDLHAGLRPAPFDAQALVALAGASEDDRSGLLWQDWSRYSARQGQQMKLGGVVGTWTLRGPLSPLVPWFQLGQWLHLGKNTTMGLGGFRLELRPAATAQPAPGPDEAALGVVRHQLSAA